MQSNTQNALLEKQGNNLTIKVYNEIRQLMMDYEIVPGQRLVFTDLGKRLGVSRTPVNNALYMLAKDGFLDFIPNQGYTVHKITREEADSLYDIRKILALGAVGDALRNMTSEKLEILRRTKQDYEDAVADEVTRGRFVLDQEYHACLVDMSGNMYLAGYFRDVYQRIFLRHRMEGLRAERAKAVLQEHDAIFEAVEMRDVERAKSLISNHIEAGKQYIYSYIFNAA